MPSAAPDQPDPAAELLAVQREQLKRDRQRDEARERRLTDVKRTVALLIVAALVIGGLLAYLAG